METISTWDEKFEKRGATQTFIIDYRNLQTQQEMEGLQTHNRNVYRIVAEKQTQKIENAQMG